MNRADRKLWRTARNLPELGHLMAAWLEGEIESRPGYHGLTDLDSPELTALCARLCRAGVVTHQSQAAQTWAIDGRTKKARLYIMAFADDTTVARLHAACSDTDLGLIANRTPDHSWFRGHTGMSVVPVVMSDDDRVHLTLTPPIPRSYVDIMWDGIHQDAHAAVLDAWQIVIADAVWGRNELTHDVLGRRFLGEVRP